MSTFMLTASGAEYHLWGAAQAHNVFAIEDIAHALAQINRFNGHAKRPYSVAEHSLLCADIAERMELPPPVQLACLMHDAHEAYTGDASTPAKRAIGDGWAAFELGHEVALRKHFGLAPMFRQAGAAIVRVDLCALATERRDLMRWDAATSRPWEVLLQPGVQAADWVDLSHAKHSTVGWSEWRDRFTERFLTLKRARAEWQQARMREMQA